MVAPTGTNAHGPGNSLTPSISAPQDRIAASATTATAVRNHIGQRTYGTSAPTSAPSNSSQAAGEAVVVGGGLVGVVRNDRVDERRDGQRTQQHDQRNPHVPAEKPPEQQGEQEDQRQEGDIELALHRHRPDVLQRADRLTGAKVVRRGGGQLPVLVVAQARQALVSKRLPARLGLHEDGQHRRRGEHDDQRGQQSPDQSRHLGHRPQRGARGQCGAQQATAEEESRQRQKNVDTTGNAAEPDVKHRNEGNRDTAQAIEIVAVETRLPGSHGGAWGGTGFGNGRRPWRGEGHHGRRSIYLRSGRPLRPANRPVALAIGSFSVPALTPGQISAIDAAHIWHPYSTDRGRSVAAGGGGRSPRRVADGDQRRTSRRRARRDEFLVDRHPRARPPGAGRGDHQPARHDEPRHVRRADPRTGRPAGASCWCRSLPTGWTPCSSPTPDRSRSRSRSRWRCSTGAASAVATSTG